MSTASLSNAPVAFLIFNRPELTARVFERIRLARPIELFVIADGPRLNKPTDVEKCALARKITEQVDWPCTVHRDYSETNLGCGRRVSSGLDWVFSKVDRAIILEDDCLPDPTFFPFCAELLDRYENQPRVGLISGSHHQRESIREGASYYFCRYGNIWGWATWRRAWERFDLTMSEWETWRDGGNLETLFSDKSVRDFWREVWNETADGKHDTWDYQWTFCYMRYGMLGVLPRVSLIENIGFGEDASHTGGVHFAAPNTEAVTFPLRHPVDVEPDLSAEMKASRRFFSKKTFFQKVMARLVR